MNPALFNLDITFFQERKQLFFMKFHKTKKKRFSPISSSIDPSLHSRLHEKPKIPLLTFHTKYSSKFNHLGGDPVVKAWDQEVCSLCGLRFEPYGCSYDDHWRLTWSLTSRPVGLVKVHAS